MGDQLEFPGIPTPEPHANRGREFELMLERTHEFYVRAGIGWVQKISNKWVYCSEGEWRRLPAPMKARTGDGKPLKRAQTPCDYLGHAFGYGVAFDAKEFAGPSLPLEKLKSHQVQALSLFSRTRGLAGFLLWSKRVDRVYWLTAEQVLVANNGPSKSLNIAWLDQHARLITDKARGATVDWAGALLKDKTR